MQIVTGLAGSLAIASVLALSANSANAGDWCGFHQYEKAHSQVRCGYSSLQECKEALTEKTADDKTVCVPDPESG